MSNPFVETVKGRAWILAGKEELVAVWPEVFPEQVDWLIGLCGLPAKEWVRAVQVWTRSRKGGRYVAPVADAHPNPPWDVRYLYMPGGQLLRSELMGSWEWYQKREHQRGKCPVRPLATGGLLEEAEMVMRFTGAQVDCPGPEAHGVRGTKWVVIGHPKVRRKKEEIGRFVGLLDTPKRSDGPLKQADLLEYEDKEPEPAPQRDLRSRFRGL